MAPVSSNHNTRRVKILCICGISILTWMAIFFSVGTSRSLEVSDSRLASPKSTYEKFLEWRDYSRQTHGFHCSSRLFKCVGPYTLGFKPFKAFTRSTLLLRSGMCPEKFRTGYIYVCNRGMNANGFWRNVLHKNKIEQHEAYTIFDQFVAGKLKSGPDYLPEGCPFGAKPSTVFPKLETFYPESYSIRTQEEAASVLDVLRKKTNVLNEIERAELMYLLKANEMHSGQGIMIADINSTIEWIAGESVQTKKEPEKFPVQIQKFMRNPLLWSGKKFQLRSWAVFYSLKPLMVTAHIGHLNFASANFSVENLVSAITNAVVPNMTDEESLAHFGGFQQLIDHFKKNGDQIEKENGKKYPKDFIEAQVIPQMYDIMRFVISAGFSDAERYVHPKRKAKFPTTESTGYFNATIVERICYDFVIERNGKVYLTEENRMCRDPSYFGFDDLTKKYMDFRPDWKKDLVSSLDAQSIEIAEEIYYRKHLGLPYSFSDLDTPFGYHVPIIDQTKYQTLGWEERALCNPRLFAVDDVAKPFLDNLHVDYFEYSDPSREMLGKRRKSNVDAPLKILPKFA